MTAPPIRFNDGAAYERGMGGWSRLAGEVFLDWLAPSPGQRWIDVGCGSGAFTALVVQRHAPAEAQGVDPSDAQLAFARTRPEASHAVFQVGDALALPFPDNRFDAAVMALVLFFVPDPPKGVGEMVRVVRPGGIVAAYAWDILDGGFPFEPIWVEMRKRGVAPPLPPSPEASRIDQMQKLWTQAGLEEVETRVITVQRTFASFDELWAVSTTSGSILPLLNKMSPAEVAQFRDRVHAGLPAPDAQGRITHGARANAVKGRVPA